MSFIKEWFKNDKERTQEVLDKCNKVYDEYGTNYKNMIQEKNLKKKLKKV